MKKIKLMLKISKLLEKRVDTSPLTILGSRALEVYATTHDNLLKKWVECNDFRKRFADNFYQ